MMQRNRKPKMIGNWEIAALDEAECHWRLSKANLEGAIRLCQDTIEGSLESSFSHASVILSLYHHGIELFLKYAIIRGGGEFHPNHYIRGLFEIYSEIYKGKEYSLDLPFISQYLGFSPEEIEERIEEEGSRHNRNQTDQMHRYHTGHDGNQWDGAHGFEPNPFLIDADSLKSKFEEINSLIENP